MLDRIIMRISFINNGVSFRLYDVWRKVETKYLYETISKYVAVVEQHWGSSYGRESEAAGKCRWWRSLLVCNGTN